MDVKVDVVELVDVEAADDDLVFAEPGQQLVGIGSIDQPLEGQVGLSGRESDGGKAPSRLATL